MDERVINRLGLDEETRCRIYLESDGNRKTSSFERDLPGPENRQVRVCPTPASWGGMVRWLTGMKLQEGTGWNLFEETFDKRVPYSVHAVARDISEQEMYDFIEKHYH